MDFKQIQELLKLINKSNIGELSIEENGFKITIKQKKEYSQNTMVSPIAQLPSIQPVSKIDPPKNVISETAKEDNFVTIKSPMIGTFYRQSAPGKPILVNVGDEVVPGTIVCIIEAMKLFNEIESEITGKIVKVLVEDV
jgi:acetyl-CoA carboxylase biotin carboxyl carrier protein